MNSFERYFPWAAATFAALIMLLTLLPPTRQDGQPDIYEFGRLPVQSGGRIKPFDSVARTTLMVLSNRQTWLDAKGDSQPAINWLLDVLTTELKQDGATEKYKIFRIEDLDLLHLLELEPRPGSWRYSIDEMRPRFAAFDEKAQQALAREPAQRDRLERKALELRRHMEMYLELSRWHEPRMIPPRSGTHWQPLLEAAAQERSTGERNEALRHVAGALMAYSKKDAKGFNEAVAQYRAQLERDFPGAVSTAGLESTFNMAAPFYWCSIFYIVGFLINTLGWLVWREPMRRGAFALISVMLVVHTLALIARMMIGGRPPVTNLYSSAIFIGWATVILGLLIERFWGMGLGNFVASVTGFATVLIAHFLGTSGDTLDVLQAVLDTNFWLATHVTCITLGYAATYVAGILGMSYIAVGVFTKSLTRDLSKSLAQAMYGVVCFAMFLSFTGTVLGGIWADQSWGRFWGWDPKENGALLIVLINALVLHARWGGMVKERGMAVLNILGNIVTTWSWFGVNMLGVGLHSYGFMEGAFVAILSAIGVFMSFVVAGVLPFRFWASVDVMNQPAPSLPRPKAQGRPRA